MNILNKNFSKVFVISLNRSIEEDDLRRSRFEARFPDLEFEYFDGIDGSTVDKQFYLDRGSKLTRGQLGCLLSHLALYKIISEKKLERCLIFEDDVVWVSSPEVLQASVDQLPENFGFFLPGWCGYFNSNFSNNLSTLCRNNVFSSSFHCTHAMVLDHVWAKKLLDLNSERFHQTADGAISELVFSQDLTAYVSIPKIFDQDGMSSIVGQLCT